MVEVAFWWSLCSYHEGGHLVVYGDHAEEDCEDVELAQFAGPPASRGQHQQQAHRGQGRPTHREIQYLQYLHYLHYLHSTIYRVFSKGRNAVCPFKYLIFWTFPDVLGFF